MVVVARVSDVDLYCECLSCVVAIPLLSHINSISKLHIYVLHGYVACWRARCQHICNAWSRRHSRSDQVPAVKVEVLERLHQVQQVVPDEPRALTSTIAFSSSQAFCVLEDQSPYSTTLDRARNEWITSESVD